MVGHTHNEDLLIHVFYDSLTGTAAQCYVKLKNEQICTWIDLTWIFLGRYKYMLEIIPDCLTFQNMKKEPKENYKKYAVKWKNVASLVRPSLTNREENSMFVDTLPSPYDDMLVVNALVEFEDLMYYVGRIEDGIKRGKITDIRASMMEKKRIILDKHVQTVFRERGSKKRSHMAREEPIKNHLCSSLYAQVPPIDLHSPQKFAQEHGQEFDSSYPRGNKRKRTKVYHALPILI